jgi:hypothetical protein
MTLSTISINNMIAPLNWRHLTFSICLVYSIAINTITAILVIIVTLCTVLNITLFTRLHSCKWFMLNVSSLLTFETSVLLHTSIAISHWTVCTLWSCGMDLLTYTTVLNWVSRNISVAIYSPICSPLILYDPILLSISYQ